MTPRHPYFISFKQSHVLLWHLIWAANVEPKTGIDVGKNAMLNVWIRQQFMDDLRRLHPLSPEEAPQTSHWGVNGRDAHAYLQLSDINIRFAMKKIHHLYFYLCFVFSKG